MLSVSQPGAGYRRYDAHFAAAEATANQYAGLARGKSPSHALAAFKRAAPHLGINSRIVHLLDLLFAWTKPQDWEERRQPIVWPKNETLAEAMGIEIRQLQNLMKQAVALRLVSHVDSPNGHRGGVRESDGHIRWAYGIDLRPIGTRMAEFAKAAEEGLAERRLRDDLRRRLTIARKSIAQLAQTAIDNGFGGCDWLAEVETARMAAEHVQGSRELGRLSAVVEQIELRKRKVHVAFAAAMALSDEAQQQPTSVDMSVDNAPTDEADCMDYTTTTNLQTAKADIRIGLAGKSSGGELGETETTPSTRVEEDMDKYGIGIDFIAKACKEITWQLDYGQRTWAEVFAIAEDLAACNFINANTWGEACRIMGRRGAAAAMIAIAHKEYLGLVKSPGGYLRGMTKRAMIGELHLGRTYHGIKEGSSIQ